MKLPLAEDPRTARLGFYSYWTAAAAMTDAEGTTISDNPWLKASYYRSQNLAVLSSCLRRTRSQGPSPRAQVCTPSAGHHRQPRDYTLLLMWRERRRNTGAVPERRLAASGAGAPAAAGIQAEGPNLIPTIVGSGAETAVIVNDILESDELREKARRSIVLLADESELDGVDIEFGCRSRAGFGVPEFVTRLGQTARQEEEAQPHAPTPL